MLSHFPPFLIILSVHLSCSCPVYYTRPFARLYAFCFYSCCQNFGRPSASHCRRVMMLLLGKLFFRIWLFEICYSHTWVNILANMNIEIRDELAEKLRFDGECSRSANVLAKIWILRWMRPKWRFNSEYFHLGLNPRSSSVGPLIILISFEYILRMLYQRLSMPLRMLPTLTHALPTLPILRLMTVFTTFADI